MIDMDDILGDNILWQMSYAEKMAVIYLLGKLRNKSAALEVGSYKGGSTRVLTQRFEKVYSCDIDHSAIVHPERYENVDWVEGDSAATVPPLIERANATEEIINLFLIDGDHSCEAVSRDITNILEYRPLDDAIILLHDSWYGGCREAINRTDWGSSPYVDYVEKDFVAGDICGSDNGNFLVGGLALVTLSPKKRHGYVRIEQSQDHMYSVCKQLLSASMDIYEIKAIWKRLIE